MSADEKARVKQTIMSFGDTPAAATSATASATSTTSGWYQ
jgi:hypothetical protein